MAPFFVTILTIGSPLIFLITELLIFKALAFVGCVELLIFEVLASGGFVGLLIFKVLGSGGCVGLLIFKVLASVGRVGAVVKIQNQIVTFEIDYIRDHY